MGNTLEPMHDGEPRRGVDSAATDGDIDSMARALRLGLYESVLASHTGPVKFVCALGQQSMGKSYQLNHLGGTLFDVAGGRCTDGVWMSARFMRDAAGAETAVVFLDCEGIGSPQRHEVEDMLHCLFVGAVSSLTMFKTHFALTSCASSPPVLYVVLQEPSRCIPVSPFLDIRPNFNHCGTWRPRPGALEESLGIDDIYW